MGCRRRWSSAGAVAPCGRRPMPTHIARRALAAVGRIAGRWIDRSKARSWLMERLYAPWSPVFNRGVRVINGSRSSRGSSLKTLRSTATPASLQRTTAGRPADQGWIRQWSSHNSQHRRWLEHSCGQGCEPSQGIADENGGLANDLPDEGPHLPPPQTVIQGESAMESGLGGASEANQIQGIDPVALFRQRGSTRSPMLTVGTESVQQEQCRTLTGAQRTPVDCLSLPCPRLVAPPVKGSPLGSLEARCRQGAD